MRSLAWILALAAAAAASGCSGTLTYPGTTDFEVAKGYDARRPAEVAVLPVSGSLDPVSAAHLREGLRARLLDLRYAPVRLKEVDSRIADYKPGGPHAVLEIRVTEWEDGALFGDGSLLYSAEVRLFGAGSTEVLFRGTVDKVTVRASSVAKSMEDRPTTIAQACAEAAFQLLEKLPVKGDG